MLTLLQRFRSLKWFWKLGIIFATVPLVICVGGYLFHVIQVTRHSSSQMRMIDRALPAFIAFQNSSPLISDFNDSSAKRDAGEYLNTKIAWIFDQRYINWPPPNSVTLDDLPSLKETFDTWGESWADHYLEIDYTKYDFAWMSDLLQYDHWNIWKNSPIELMDQQGKFLLYSYPVPRVSLFLLWSKLRFMRTLKGGEPQPAVQEVRHVAKLLYTTETILGQIGASNLLRLEEAFYSAYKNKYNHAPWQPYSNSDIKKSWNSSRIIGTLLLTEANLPRVKRQLGKMPKAFGLCAGLSEALTNWTALHPFLHVYHKKTYKMLDDIVKQTGSRCRLDIQFKHWKNKTNNFWGHATATKLRRVGYVPVVGYEIARAFSHLGSYDLKNYIVEFEKRE